MGSSCFNVEMSSTKRERGFGKDAQAKDAEENAEA